MITLQIDVITLKIDVITQRIDVITCDHMCDHTPNRYEYASNWCDHASNRWDHTKVDVITQKIDVITHKIDVITCDHVWSRPKSMWSHSKPQNMSPNQKERRNRTSLSLARRNSAHEEYTRWQVTTPVIPPLQNKIFFFFGQRTFVKISTSVPNLGEVSIYHRNLDDSTN